MADTSATTGAPATAIVVGLANPLLDILRDIARGGFAGIIVGIFVAGLGGRLVMRLATILHEDAVGLATENGELIGRISFNGTMALITFGGLGMGLLAGTIWVVISPWLPAGRMRRAAVTALAAIALGTPPLVQQFNPDFMILDHDPVVVALLVALVGLVGLSISFVDGVLDRRLPHPTRWKAPSSAAYLVVVLLGILILPLAVAAMLGNADYDAPIRAGWGLAATGVCTFAWWVVRLRGGLTPPRTLRLAGRASLVIAVILGLATSLPNIIGAAGLT